MCLYLENYQFYEKNFQCKIVGLVWLYNYVLSNKLCICDILAARERQILQNFHFLRIPKNAVKTTTEAHIFKLVKAKA